VKMYRVRQCCWFWWHHTGHGQTAAGCPNDSRWPVGRTPLSAAQWLPTAGGSSPAATRSTGVISQWQNLHNT